MQFSPTESVIQPKDLSFGRLFETIRDAAIVVDISSGMIVLWNPAATAIFGHTLEEARHHRLEQLVPVYRQVSQQAGLQHPIANAGDSIDSVIVHDLSALHKSGDLLQIEMTLNPMPDVDDGKRFMLAIIRDITARTRETLTLRESQARFHSAFTYAAIGMSLVASDGRFLQINRAFCDLTGYSEQELLHLSFQDITHPDDLHIDLDLMHRLLRGETRSYQMEKRYVHKTGYLVWILLSVSLVEDQSGQPLYFISQVQDISVRKQAEQNLRESEARFRSLFELSPNGLVLMDPFAPDGNWPIVDCNEVFCRMNGYPREEIIGQSIEMLNAFPGPREYLGATLARLREEGTVHGETLHRRKDGTLFPIEFLTSLLNLAGRELVLGIDRDITLRNEIDGELQSVNEQLASRVQELQEHTNELTILSQLSTMVQVCRTAEEAYSVIATSLGALLPHEAGCLSIFQSSGDLLEPVATWGERSPPTAFGADDCWALRRGQMYSVDAAHPWLPCSHVGFPAPSAYICLPMIARGETFGVLHLFHADEMGLSEAKLHLAQTVAAHLGLVLANLRLQESLRYQSLRDALTGLYNRRYLEGALEREANRALRLGQSIGVLMMDIDHYKQFNDSYGHSAGDTVLRAVGNLLRAQSRGEDVVCRYGGEEFGLMLPGATVEASWRRAEHIRIAIKELQVQHGDQLVGQITCSIGVAAFPQHGATLTEVIEYADQAMYRAKHEGRDRVVVG